MEESEKKIYICGACGWIYDPAHGDPENGVPRCTAFEDLPEKWVCPECKVGQDAFRSLDPA